jgi:hypothetical protein
MHVFEDEPPKSLLAHARCQCCGEYGGNCGHLLIAFEGNGHSVVAGALKKDVQAFLEAFIWLGESVIDRDVVCGNGIVREAMTQVYERWGPGISVDELLGAELTRDFAYEYLWKGLDIAPNLWRVTFPSDVNPDLSDGDQLLLVWSNMPEAARSVVHDLETALRQLAK